MTDPSPQQLGESLAALIGGEWQLDAADVLLAGPTAEREADSVPLAEAVEPEPATAPPPLARAAAEPDVPPGPVQILEALLFAGGTPLSAGRACAVVRGLTPDQIRASVEVLNRVYKAQNRPYHVVPRGEGYVLAARPGYAGVRERLFGGPREARLTQPALDVLAVVAYRQPVTRGDIDALRGADSVGVVRHLVRLGLIEVARRGDGAKPEPSYGTTRRFLETFGLACAGRPAGRGRPATVVMSSRLARPAKSAPPTCPAEPGCGIVG